MLLSGPVAAVAIYKNRQNVLAKGDSIFLLMLTVQCEQASSGYSDNGQATPAYSQQSGYQQTTPRNGASTPHDAVAASADSISDMINGMQRSGKFVVKKPPVSSADGSKLVREHLQVVFQFPP